MTARSATRRVVLVAPDFPPANMAGAHRPRLFAKHLERFGWTPTVLTIRRDRIEGPLDPTLEELLSPGLDVIRTGAIPTKPIRVIGDPALRSIAVHARELSALARRGESQAVVLFGPPWFSFVLGPFVRRRFGVPYVVDYIDPWISDWPAGRVFPRKAWFHDRAAAAIEPWVLRGAAHVTAVSDAILEDLQKRYPSLDRDRMSAMPYGAEPDDFTAADRLGIRPPDFSSDGGEVTVAFPGAMQTTGRPLVMSVLKAAGMLRDSGTDVGRRLRLRFYGTSNLTWGHGRHTVLPLARALGVADIVTEIPERIPYLQALSVLRSCDVVLVAGSIDAYYHASKLYPALISGRPILAICHRDASITGVMAETQAGETITFTEPAELERRAADVARSLESLAGRGPRRMDHPSFERFTARASTAVLAGILDRITAAPVLAEAV